MALVLQIAFSRRVEVGDLAVFGAVIGLLGFARLALVALERQRSEQQFRSMIENGSDVILIMSSEGSIEYLSPSAERIFGFPVEHYIGQSRFDFLHAEDREEAGQVFSRVLSGGTEEAEYRVHTSDGSYRRMATTARLIESGPHAGGVLLNADDVTDRRAVEAELAKRDDQLRQTQKMEAVGQLAGGVAHDFNNLLTAIQGYGEFARAGAEEAGLPKLQSDIGEILRSADRAAELTRHLLAFSRRQRLESVPLELNELIANLDKLLRRLIGEHIEFVTLFADEPCWVEADAGQLEQVVVNLAVNSRDAMPAGGTLTIAVGAEASTVWLTVSDTGHGMDAETQARAFEPFFTTKPLGQGTGLGLATVYGVVAQSGGEIKIDSSPAAASTTFTVTLPRTTAPAALDPGRRRGRSGGSGRTDPARRGRADRPKGRRPHPPRGRLRRARGQGRRGGAPCRHARDRPARPAPDGCRHAPALGPRARAAGPRAVPEAARDLLLRLPGRSTRRPADLGPDDPRQAVHEQRASRRGEHRHQPRRSRRLTRTRPRNANDRRLNAG